jgi:predicted ArsR family transcriptional regulator
MKNTPAGSKVQRRKPTNPAVHDFTFLTNHSHVLICLAKGGDMTLREVAMRVGITERAVLAIVKDLTLAKVLSVSKKGRRNVYRINPQIHLRHPVEQHKTVGDLLKSILD